MARTKQPVAAGNGEGAAIAALEAGVEVQATSIYIPKPKIATVDVPIVGTNPLLVHAWSKKARDQMLNRQMKRASGPKEAKNPEEDFNGSRYLAVEGWDGVPSAGFKAALVGACRQVDKFPMTLAKRLLFVEAEGRGVNGQGLVQIRGAQPEMHEAMVRLESGVADVRFRAIYRDWRAVLRIRFNAGMLSAEMVFNLVAIAGLSEGCCEWRPSAPNSSTGEMGTWEIDQESAAGIQGA